jgi:hypothetical protein
MPTKSQIDALKNISIQAVKGNSRMETQLKDIFDEIEGANETIEEAIQAFKKAEAAGADPDELASLQQQLSGVSEEMISKVELDAIIAKAQRGQTQGSRELVGEAIREFREKALGSGDIPPQLTQILAELTRIANSLEAPQAPLTLETYPKPEWRSAYNATNQKGKTEIASKVIEVFNYSIGKPLRTIFDELAPGQDDKAVRTRINKMKKDELVKFLTTYNTAITNALMAPQTPTGPPIAAVVASPLLEGTAAAGGEEVNLGSALNLFGQGDGSYGFKHLQANRRIGKGIAQTPKRYDIIKKEQIDYNKGIEPVKKWVKFGKNVINIQRLNDDIVAVKREKGSGITGIKSLRVSKKLGNVFRKIIGNGMPSFEELQNLDGDEKDYLYKVVKASDLLEKLNIPTPSKDEEEKDIHQFELMKGQILAGNNSNELIKKFKILLMKLMYQGKIPKSQAKDILLDLVESGF